MNGQGPDATARGSGSVSRAAVAKFFVVLVLFPASLFLAAGRLDWWPAWFLVALLVVLSLVGRAIMARTAPDLMAERARYTKSEGIKDWDKILAPIVAICGPFAMWIVSGLDVRFERSPPFAISLQIAAALVILLAYSLSAWAMTVNRFFSSVVRIQSDRGHEVVTSGPYRAVRHPGYVGGMVTTLATPILLGSLWGLVPGGLTAAVLVLRTALEDRTLREELPGYAEYAQRTRYRLLPGVW